MSLAGLLIIAPHFQADALKYLGLDELGYVFLTIDDNWHLPDRDNITGNVILLAQLHQCIYIYIPREF